MEGKSICRISPVVSLLVETNLGLGVFKEVLLDKEAPEAFIKFVTQTSLPTIQSGGRLSLINDTLSDTPGREMLTRDGLEVNQVDCRGTTYMYPSNDTYLPHAAPTLPPHPQTCLHFPILKSHLSTSPLLDPEIEEYEIFTRYENFLGRKTTRTGDIVAKGWRIGEKLVQSLAGYYESGQVSFIRQSQTIIAFFSNTGIELCRWREQEQTNQYQIPSSQPRLPPPKFIPGDSLYSKVDLKGIGCLNERVQDMARNIIKPWNQRFDTEKVSLSIYLD